MNNSNQQSLSITRGLEQNITKFNELEQGYINKVAAKLRENGYPLHQITRVELKKRITDRSHYYSYNEVVFLINPAIYKKGFSNATTINIGVGWEHPSTLRNADGSVEFQFGPSIKKEDLFMIFYRLSDSYTNYALIDQHDLALQKINKVLLNADIKEIKYLTSKGIMKLSKNYHLLSTTEEEHSGVINLTLNNMEDNLLIDDGYVQKIGNSNYHLKIDINAGSVEILNSYIPNFYPTPAAHIIERTPKKEKK